MQHKCFLAGHQKADGSQLPYVTPLFRYAAAKFTEYMAQFYKKRQHQVTKCSFLSLFVFFLVPEVGPYWLIERSHLNSFLHFRKSRKNISKAEQITEWQHSIRQGLSMFLYQAYGTSY